MKSYSYLWYVALSVCTIVFSIYSVKGVMHLEDLKVIMMYIMFMLGHYMYTHKALKGRRDRRDGDGC